MKNNNLPRIHSPWKRMFLDLYLSCLILLGTFQSARARVHWVGGRRTRRYERQVIVILFLIATIVLESRDVAIWAAVWGGMTAVFVVLYSVLRLLPRKERP